MTYKEIQSSYKIKHNATIKTCWIADVKRKLGLPMRERKSKEPVKYPCPNDVIKKRIEKYLRKKTSR